VFGRIAVEEVPPAHLPGDGGWVERRGAPGSVNDIRILYEATVGQRSASLLIPDDQPGSKAVVEWNPVDRSANAEPFMPGMRIGPGAGAH